MVKYEEKNLKTEAVIKINNNYKVVIWLNEFDEETVEFVKRNNKPCILLVTNKKYNIDQAFLPFSLVLDASNITINQIFEKLNIQASDCIIIKNNTTENQTLTNFDSELQMISE